MRSFSSILDHNEWDVAQLARHHIPHIPSLTPPNIFVFGLHDTAANQQPLHSSPLLMIR